MRTNKGIGYALIISTAVFFGSTALAGQHTFVGARAGGMGGANAASVKDATAQWHNPAVLGFMGSAQEESVETNEVAAVESNAVENAEASVAVAAEVLSEVAGSTNIIEEIGSTEESPVAGVEQTVPDTNTVPEEADLAVTEEPPVAEDPVLEEDPTTVTNEAPEIPADSDLLPVPAGAMFESEDLEPSEQASTAEESYNLLDNNGLSKRRIGWSVLDLSMGYTMTEDMGRYLDIITDINFDTVDDVSSSAEVSDLVAMASALGGLDQGGNALYVDSNIGTSVRIGSFAIGLRMHGESAIWVDKVDTANLGVGAGLNAELDAVSGSDPGFIGYTPSVLSADQKIALSAGLDPTDIDYIDYQLSNLLADGTIEQSDINNAVDLLIDIAASGGALNDNETAVAARGFAMAEIPVSYGWEVNESLAFGVTAKAMMGRVLGTKVWVFDENNLDEAVESVSDTESDTLTFGLDLGALYRIENFQFAAVGHNLNRPTFDGYTDTITYTRPDLTIVSYDVVVPDVKIDPQVTLGAAYIPSRRFMLEVNYDALETGTLLNGYDIQRLSLGSEFDVWALALRIGAYKNLAMSDSDWVATVGVGVNIFGVHADVGGAYSLGDEVEYDGNEIPAEARIFASIGLDF